MAGILRFINCSSGPKHGSHSCSKVDTRTHLHGDAGHVIGGFPLSDRNYPHCVKLLKERFGQQYKLVDAHMKALLNMLTPSNSLQAFYDTIQNHIRALSALRNPPKSCGPMLIAVILPSEVKIRMACDYYDSAWTYITLLDSLLKEIHIYKTGHQPGCKLQTSSSCSRKIEARPVYFARVHIKLTLVPLSRVLRVDLQ